MSKPSPVRHPQRCSKRAALPRAITRRKSAAGPGMAPITCQGLPSQDKTVHVFDGYPHTEYIDTGGTLIPFTAYRPRVAIA